MLKIKIKYHDKKMPRIEKMTVGNWIDLRAIEGGTVISSKDGIKRRARWRDKVKNIDGEEFKVKSLKYKKGDILMLNLGVTIVLPEGHELLMLPRSSTAKNYGLVQLNSMGVGDTSFRGNKDIYHMPCMAIRDGEIELYDRVCQFRIIESMPELEVEEIDDTGYDNRGGFGSTGTT